MEKNKLDRWIDYCFYCPKMCRFSCPVANAERSESVTPTMRVSFYRYILKNKIELNRESGELFYKCLFCLRCREFCYHEIEVPEIMLSARRHIFKNKKELAPTIEEVGKIEAKKELFSRFVSDEAQVIFFPGCRSLANESSKIFNFMIALDKIGIDYVGLYHGDNSCCGYPYYALGDEGRFKASANSLYSKISHAKKIVVECPSCLYMLYSEYKKLGLDLTKKLVHLTSFLRDLTKNRVKKESKILYHDPCYLGRYMSIYEDPRLIARNMGFKIMEFPSMMEKAYCCGSGGLIPSTNPSIKDRVATQLMSEADGIEFDKIYTPCPSCRMTLDPFAKTVGPMDLLIEVTIEKK